MQTPMGENYSAIGFFKLSLQKKKQIQDFKWENGL